MEKRKLVVCARDFDYFTGKGFGILEGKKIKMSRTLAFGCGYAYYNENDKEWIDNSYDIKYVYN